MAGGKIRHIDNVISAEHVNDLILNSVEQKCYNIVVYMFPYLVQKSTITEDIPTFIKARDALEIENVGNNHYKNKTVYNKGIVPLYHKDGSFKVSHLLISVENVVHCVS